MAAVASIRVIKRKIRSDQNIKKITRAMQMVSAAKLRKVQDRLMQIRPYSDKIREFLGGLATRVREQAHPLFTPRAEVKRIGVVAVLADKGLCGSYNSNMMRFANRFLGEHGKPGSVIAVGRKAVYWANREGLPMVAEHVQLPTEIPFAEIQKIAKRLVDWFTKGEVDEVHLLFTRYVNAMTFRPGSVKFLPIEAEDGGKALAHDYIFEPDPAKILDHLVPRYVETTLHRLLLESMSSEHAARMNAMRNATDNADDLFQSLTLTYNKARQAGITKELLDIVGGAEALK